MIAYATFAHSPPESLLTAVSEHALLSLSKFEQQAIANLIWALALLHALTPNMWNQLLEAFSNVDDQQGMLLLRTWRPQGSIVSCMLETSWLHFGSIFASCKCSAHSSCGLQ